MMYYRSCLLSLSLVLGACGSEEERIDADLDGFTEDVDCNDNDARIHPNAEEVCDSVDNNCDGAIDDASATGQTTWYADLDGDSFGDAANTVDACVAPVGYVADNTDCDDSDSELRPDDRDGDGFSTCSKLRRYQRDVDSASKCRDAHKC